MSKKGSDKDGLSPLMKAAKDGNVLEVKKLFESGANPNQLDTKFRTSSAYDFVLREMEIKGPKNEYKDILKLLDGRFSFQT